MIVQSTKELISSFRESRNQKQQAQELDEKRTCRETKQKNDPYQIFIRKYDNLEKYLDSFKTRDFVYYFKEVSNSYGVKYTISNLKKDMAIFKRLSQNYSPREICGMIDFLFESEQDYLDRDRLSPNLLASQWVNTIYADMNLWVEDKYVPKSKEKHKTKEWVEDTTSANSTIGEWE